MNTKVLSIGLILNEISVSDIINWSDANIYEGKEDELFMDISSITAKNNKKQLVEILNQYATNFSESNFHKFNRLYLSFLGINTMDWQKIQEKLIFYHDLTNEDYKVFLSNDEFEFRTRLRDDYMLRKDGFSGCMKMPNELNEYLKPFKESSVEKENFFNAVFDKFGNVPN